MAVADDGFDLTHPDFQGDGKVVASLNATVRDNGISAGLDWDDDPNFPGRVNRVYCETAARGFYGRWAQLLSGASWDELAVTPPQEAVTTR